MHPEIYDGQRLIKMYVHKIQYVQSYQHATDLPGNPSLDQLSDQNQNLCKCMKNMSFERRI